MNEKTGKMLMGIVVCAVVLMAIVVATGFGNTEKKEDLSVNNSEDIQHEVTDQSKLEVIVEEPVQSEDKIVEKKEASYERWLAAGMVVGVSLQYSEFEFTGIYLASECELGNANTSKGVYIVFECGGQEIALYSKPIKEERTEAGTKDLYTEELGFATFDEIKPDSIEKDECVSIEMDELSELIRQSVLVTVYEH